MRSHKALLFLMLIAFSLVLTSCSPFTRQKTALLKLLNEILVLDPDTKSHEKLLRQMDLSSEEASGVDIHLTLLTHAFDGHWGYALFQLDTPVSTVPPDMSTIALGFEITYQINGQPILLADFYDLPTAAALELPGRPGGLHTSLAWKSPPKRRRIPPMSFYNTGSMGQSIPSHFAPAASRTRNFQWIPSFSERPQAVQSSH